MLKVVILFLIKLQIVQDFLNRLSKFNFHKCLQRKDVLLGAPHSIGKWIGLILVWKMLHCIIQVIKLIMQFLKLVLELYILLITLFGILTCTFVAEYCRQILKTCDGTLVHR